MTWLLETILYAVPWWVLLVAGAVVGLVVYRALGARMAILAAAVVAVLVAHSKGAQSGWKAREAKGARDAQRAIDRAARARAASDRRNAGSDRVFDNDGWRRD